MIALMFGGLFGGAINVPDGSSYFEFLMPGMFTTNHVVWLGNDHVGRDDGCLAGRDRPLPFAANQSAARLCWDAVWLTCSTRSLVCCILIVAGLLLGWRWHRRPAAGASGVRALLLLRFALLWIGIFLGLNPKSPEAASPYRFWSGRSAFFRTYSSILHHARLVGCAGALGIRYPRLPRPQGNCLGIQSFPSLPKPGPHSTPSCWRCSGRC